MTEATPQPGAAARKRRRATPIEQRLEDHLVEIRAEIAQHATKEDLEEVKRHVDRRADEILEAIECRVGSSSNK